LSPKCYPDYQAYQDVDEYFGTALDLRVEYDLFRILSNGNVFPNSSYPITDFEEAIQSAIHVKPVITCSGSSLKDIWIYFHVKNRDQYVPTDRPTHLPAGVEKELCHGIVNYPEKYIK
jgi:ribonuclease T2